MSIPPYHIVIIRQATGKPPARATEPSKFESSKYTISATLCESFYRHHLLFIVQFITS
jgi:hypothetical protein